MPKFSFLSLKKGKSMNNQELLGKTQDTKDIWVFQSVADKSNFAILTTKGADINKTIFQKKQSKNKTKLVEIITEGEYTYNLLKHSIPLNEVNHECAFYERNYLRIQKEQDDIKVKQHTLSTRTQLQQLNFGLSKEEEFQPVIEKYFNTTLTHSQYECSPFDWFSPTGMLFDQKFLTYSYDMYPTELIPCNKALSNNSVFIFIHQEKHGVRCFYIRYSFEIFDKYEHFWFSPVIVGKDKKNKVECYRIEKADLIEFKLGEQIADPLVGDTNETETVLNIITRDARQAKKMVSHHSIRFVMEQLNNECKSI